MKRIFLFAFSLVALAGCWESRTFVTTELSPSGLQYTLINHPSTEDVAIQIAWETDWAYQEDLNQAVPHVGRDLLFESGAEGYPAGQAAELFADLKAEVYVNVTSDVVFGVLKFRRPEREAVVQIINAHLRSPSYDQNRLERIRGALTLASQDDSARLQSKLFSAEGWAVLGRQPLRIFLSRDESDVFSKVNLEGIRNWHNQTFTRRPKAIVVAGSLSVQDAGELIDRLFQGLPDQSHTFARKVELNFVPRRILVHVPEATSSQILFVKPLPPTREGKELEDLLITAALGQGNQSVLFKAVRTELGASYDFNSGIDYYSQDIRLFYMLGTVETGKLAETEQTVRLAYSDFKLLGPPGDVSSWAALFSYTLEVKMQTPENLAQTALLALLDNQPASRAVNLKTELDGITMEGVKARLKDAYPMPDDFLVVAVSPDATALPGACVVQRPQDAVRC